MVGMKKRTKEEKKTRKKERRRIIAWKEKGSKIEMEEYRRKEGQSKGRTEERNETARKGDVKGEE